MQIEKALINDRLRVSKVCWKFCVLTIYNFVLIVGVINLCKVNFMTCIFYNNTLKLSLYTETSQIY